MKIKLTESQYQLILEEVVGIDNFLNKMISSYPETEDFKDIIISNIEKSQCKEIKIEPVNKGLGLSLSDKLILSPTIFNFKLPAFLFIFFHELAHQYQFKKYGEKIMYDVYNSKITIEDAALFMKNVEDVADEFGMRKLQQLRRLGFIDYKDIEVAKPYENAAPDRFYFLIDQVRKLLKEKNITDSSEISEIFYNWVKVEV
jgi:hypothetical protein